jgi:hypothetical protein
METLRFAKILEVDNHQVLIVKEYDDEDDAYKVNQTTEKEGVRITMAFGFTDKHSCDDCFSKYSDENARKFLESLTSLFEEA